MEINREVSYTLKLDPTDMRLFRDALTQLHFHLRASKGVADLTPEQIASARGDGPAVQCRRAGEYADALNRWLDEEVTR
jgi:hypothetical protein